MSKQSVQGRLLTSILDRYEQSVKELLVYRQAHAEASFAELEGKVRELGREVLPKVLEALLAWGGASAGKSVGAVCGECGAPMQAKGRQQRRQETLVGEVCWEREYYYCAACRRGCYPQDEALEVSSGAFSEALQSGLARLGAGLPFRQAVETFTALTGTSVSASTAERGAAMEAGRAQEEEGWLSEGPQEGEHAQGRWAVEMDAAKVRFQDGWHEVKAGAVSPLEGEGEMVHAVSPSYTATIGGMEAAGKALYGEVVRRGVDPGGTELACVADGAPGNWEQFVLHFPHREEILDWYHAVEHLWAAGNGCYGEGTPEAKAWVVARKEELWAGQPEGVLEALNTLGQGAKGGAAQEQVGYFTANRERMRYDRYRAKGYPLGSGAVESACKRLVTARMKGAGMTWSYSGARAVLRLRVELLSERWGQAWALTHPARQAA